MVSCTVDLLKKLLGVREGMSSPIQDLFGGRQSENGLEAEDEKKCGKSEEGKPQGI